MRRWGWALIIGGMNRIFITSDGYRFHQNYVRCGWDNRPQRDFTSDSPRYGHPVSLPVIELHNGERHCVVAVEEFD